MFRRTLTRSRGLSHYLRSGKGSYVIPTSSFGSVTKIRKNELKKLTEADISAFESIVEFKSNPSAMLRTPSEVEPFNEDWMGKYKGASSLVLRPKSTDQVSAILAHCFKENLGIAVQGGKTGLVGGSVPVFDEIVLNMSRMNRLESFNEQTGIVTVESGCILEEIDLHLRDKYSFSVPLDLGAKGTCQIGGNVSTNAGGLRLCRYGNLHGNVMGLEVVLADEKGTVLDLTSNNVKDNTGIDLKQLFIGAEGALGVVTKVNLLCAQACTAKKVLFLSLAGNGDGNGQNRDVWKKVLEIKLLAKRHLNEIVSAIEFMDTCALNFSLDYMDPSVCTYPFADSPKENPFYMVIETSGSDENHDNDKLFKFIDILLNEESGDPLIKDGLISESESQFAKIWALRESPGIAINHSGWICYKYDLSIPHEEMYPFVMAVKERVRERDGEGKVIDVMGYGHLGDGNVHINVVCKEFDEKVEGFLEPWIYDLTRQMGGSISAEHGLGQMKAEMIGYSKPDEAIRKMHGIKKMFDEKGILNPYKVLPQKME